MEVPGHRTGILFFEYRQALTSLPSVSPSTRKVIRRVPQAHGRPSSAILQPACRQRHAPSPEPDRFAPRPDAPAACREPVRHRWWAFPQHGPRRLPHDRPSPRACGRSPLQPVKKARRQRRVPPVPNALSQQAFQADRHGRQRQAPRHGRMPSLAMRCRFLVCRRLACVVLRHALAAEDGRTA